MAETDIKVQGLLKVPLNCRRQGRQDHRFLLTEHLDITVARYLFNKAIRESGVPAKVAINRSGANKTAIDEIKNDMALQITIRQIKYLNNFVGQDYHESKRMTRPMLGSKSLHVAASVVAGIELVHMIRKGLC